MSELKIEPNVPLPKRYGSKLTTKYPFSKMNPLDSVLIECDGKSLTKCRSNLLHAVKVYRERVNSNFQYTTRTEPKGLRLWRLEDKQEGAEA